VLFGVGVSTNPYGVGDPRRGFGVVSGLPLGRVPVVVERGRWAGASASWVAPGVVSAEGTRNISPHLFRYRAGRLGAIMSPAVPRLSGGVAVWSGDRRWLAFERMVRLGAHTTALSGTVQVVQPGGSSHTVGHGDLVGWSPDGRVLLRTRTRQPLLSTAPVIAVDPRTGAQRTLVSPDAIHHLIGATLKTALAKPVWSADHRFMALLSSAPWRHRDGHKVFAAIVILTARGSPVRVVTSPYAISMFAWSPHDHALAYTASGFAEPHQAFVLPAPGASARRVFQTSDRHFDWITWSPSGDYLLVDDESDSHWRLIPTRSGLPPRLLPRIGGHPLWCCPQNAYESLYDG
jgi:hypothetical protein